MKITKIFSGLLFALGFTLTSCQYRDEMNAVKSLKTICDGVYFLEFEGDYGFDKYLENGGAKNTDELSAFISGQLQKGEWAAPADDAKQMKPVKISPVDFGCSSIAVKNSENLDKKIFGRNYDWQDCSVLVIHSKPTNGYESISTSCLSHIGIGADWKPSGQFLKDISALAAIYVPMDGMNEKGLYIADLIVGDKNEEPTAQERGNTSVTTTDAIRMCLDKAANVDEALELLKTHDMHSVIGRGHHFAIADSTGKAVAVEWVNNEMYVIETKVLTNHYTTESPKKDDGTNPDTENSRIRFQTLTESWENSNGAMNPAEVASVLKSVNVAQYRNENWNEGLTVWSAVFEPENKKVTYFFKENYDNKYVFELQ